MNWSKGEEQMKSYTKPEITIKKFQRENVITTSSADIDGGNAGFLDSWIKTDVDSGNVAFRDSWEQ